ncbi:MAG: hypothetical protein WCX69_02655 [Candidatus Paceibacterota bacterium]
MSLETKTRSGLPVKLSNRIKGILNFEEALFLRKMESRELEVDHKFPQVRWCKNESQNHPAMSIAEIKGKFILLTRSNNLLKSRYCEKCFKTGKRGNFPGIYYWYEGGKEWDEKIDKYDEKGCKGCFWYDPYRWREGLNGIVNK